MVDVIPSSQPVSGIVDEIESLKVTLNRQAKQLRTLKNTDNKYKNCVQTIKTSLLELEKLDLNVGDLRVTKIGKCMTKLGNTLPAELSEIATRVNEHWKTILHSYRENFKQMLSNSKCNVSKSDKVKNHQENSDTLSGLSSVQLLTIVRQTSHSSSPTYDNSSTSTASENNQHNLHDKQPTLISLQQGQMKRYDTMESRARNIDQHKLNIQQTDERQRRCAANICSNINLQPTQEHNQVLHRHQQKQQLKQHQQQQQQQQQQEQKQHQQHQQQHQQQQRHQQQQQQQDQQVQVNYQLTKSAPFSSQKLVISTFVQIFKRSLDNTTQRVNFLQKECSNILESMNQMTSDLQEFEKNIHLVLQPETINLQSTPTSNTLNPTEEEKNLLELTTISNTNNQNLKKTLNDSTANSLSVSSDLENTDFISTSYNSSSMIAQQSKTNQKDNIITSKYLNKGISSGSLDTNQLFQSVFGDINVRRKRDYTSDSDSGSSSSSNSSTAAKKQPPQQKQQQQKEHNQQHKHPTLHHSSIVATAPSDNSKQISVQIKQEPVNDIHDAESNYHQVLGQKPHQEKQEQGRHDMTQIYNGHSNHQQQNKNKQDQESVFDFSLGIVQKTNDNLRFVSPSMHKTNHLAINSHLEERAHHDSTTNVNNQGVYMNGNANHNRDERSPVQFDCLKAESRQQQQRRQYECEHFLSLQPSSAKANYDVEGFAIPQTSTNQNIIKTPGNSEVVIRDNDNNTVDEEFFTFSQQVEDMESDYIDSDEKEALLEKQNNCRKTWNNICKRHEGQKYASLKKSKGRLKAAHRHAIAKIGLNKVIENYRKTGKLQTGFKM